MLKILIQIALVYVVLQYGFKVDINQKVQDLLQPHVEGALQNSETVLPESALDLLEKAKPLLESTGGTDLKEYIQDRVESVNQADINIAELEKKMKELQEAADSAANN